MARIGVPIGCACPEGHARDKLIVETMFCAMF